MSDPEAQAAADAAVDDMKTTIDWQGVKVSLPADVEDLDPDALEALENAKAITGLRAIFGSDEYDRARAEFKKMHGRRPSMRDIDGLAGAMAEHFGFENAGE